MSRLPGKRPSPAIAVAIAANGVDGLRALDLDLRLRDAFVDARIHLAIFSD